MTDSENSNFKQELLKVEQSSIKQDSENSTNRSNDSKEIPHFDKPKQVKHDKECTQNGKRKSDNSKTDNGEGSGIPTINHDSEAKRIHLESQTIITDYSKDYLYKYMYVEKYENGGGYILHAYQNEIANLSSNDLELFINRYFKCLFRETQTQNSTNPYSLYCIGIIHGAARKIPELLGYMSQNYGNLTVKTNLMEFKNDIQTLTLNEYSKNVYSNYKNGLFRYGPLHAVSLVGTKGEETGGYFKDIIKYLEKNPFLRMVMPWGPLTKLSGMSPNDSDDGPILWMRHGEQAVPSIQNKKRSKTMQPGSSSANSGSLLNQLLPSSTRAGSIRQTLVLDRTPCHADHADDGFDRHTTAAVGALKAIHGSKDGARPRPGNYRVVKDVVCFDPRHYHDLIQRLKLDIMEPPASQCGNYWADDAELNQLRMEGYRFIRVWLRDNDIYFIPRNVVHQFKTVSSVCSIAWHARLKRYYTNTSQQPSANQTPLNTPTKVQTTHSSSVISPKMKSPPSHLLTSPSTPQTPNILPSSSSISTNIQPSHQPSKSVSINNSNISDISATQSSATSKEESLENFTSGPVDMETSKTDESLSKSTDSFDNNHNIEIATVVNTTTSTTTNNNDNDNNNDNNRNNIDNYDNNT